MPGVSAIRTFRYRAFLVLLLGWLAPWMSVSAGDDGVTVWIPLAVTEGSGAEVLRLEATLYRPDGAGPFPVVIFSHGSTGPGLIPASQTERPRDFGQYLNEQGIALLAPMRRGRGRSDGEYAEGYTCRARDIRRGIAYASASLDAVFEFLTQQAWADTERLALAGHSRGGILSLLYASGYPERVRGVINFSGGWVGDGCKEYVSGDLNLALFEEAGSKTEAPALFLYGANDSFYSDASIDAFAAAYERGGGELRYELIPVAFGADGHTLFYRFRHAWTSETDAFLRRTGMLSD